MDFPVYPVMCSLNELLISDLTPGLCTQQRPALPSSKRFAELKATFKEASALSCWADIWVIWSSVSCWEPSPSPVFLCCCLLCFLVLPRQDIKVSSSVGHTQGQAPHEACVSIFLSSIGDTQALGLLASSLLTMAACCCFYFNIFIYAICVPMWCT